jgi:hypothetical protein
MATTTINVTNQSYTTVKEESTALTQRNVLKFTGSGVTAADSGGETVVTIPGAAATTNVGLFAQTANSTAITNTTTESSLVGSGVGSLTVPANTFKVGDSFHAKLIGNISCNGSATIEIKAKADGITLADTGVINLDASTDRTWEINIYFTIRAIGGAGVASIVSGGIFSYLKNSGANFEGTNFSIINNSTFDTTINNTLDITAKWGSASTSDSIYTELFILNKMY